MIEDFQTWIRCDTCGEYVISAYALLVKDTGRQWHGKICRYIPEVVTIPDSVLVVMEEKPA